MRRAKIIATIGPATDTPEALSEIIAAGVDVVRLNFSHSTQSYHAALIERVRIAAAGCQRPVAILQDLAGPKLRIGEIGDGSVELRTGAELVLITDHEVVGTAEQVSVTYPQLAEDVGRGDRILLADGAIELTVEDSDGARVRCRVTHGGALSSRKGLNVPDASLSVESITDKDRSDVRFGLEHGVDMVALSFVRRAEDVAALRMEMESAGRVVPVVAKIEKQAAMANLPGIVATTDAVMVARGDLAVETPYAEVPMLQKQIIDACRTAGKPVITATQMLMSMVSNTRPTRAEANDVANAVLDGADALMLSEETAVGSYPARAVETMDAVICATESAALRLAGTEGAPARRAEDQPRPTVTAVAAAACQLAADTHAAAIVTPTMTGRTARAVAAHRPHQAVVAVSPNLDVVRGLTLVWGVSAHHRPHVGTYEEIRGAALQIAREALQLDAGARVVMTGTFSADEQRGITNVISVERT